MDAIYSWLDNHATICTWVVAACTLLTFVLTFMFKKKQKDKTYSQNISDIHDSTINQANGNITINSQNARKK